MSRIFALITVVFSLATAQAAQLSVRNAVVTPGSEIEIAVDYQAQDEEVTALQFEVLFDGSHFSLAAEAGNAADAGAKTVSSNQLDPNTLLVIVSGLNQNAIQDGTLVVLRVSVPRGTPQADYGFLLDSVSATDQDGEEVATAAVDGTLAVMAEETPPLLIFPQYAEGLIAGTTSRTRLVIRNNSDEPDSGEVRFFDSSGNPQQVPSERRAASSIFYELAPWSSTEIVTDGTSASLLSGPLTVHSDRGEESGLEATVIFTILGDNFVSVNPAQPRSRHQVYVSVNALENTGLAVYNPGSDGVTLDLTLLDASGAPVADPLSMVLAPGQQLSAFVTEQPLFNTFFQEESVFRGTLNIHVRDAAQVSLLGLIQRLDTGALIAIAASSNPAP